MNSTKTLATRRRLLSNSAVGFVLGCFLFSSPYVWAQPRTLRVPADFPTIQAAVNDASALFVDTVLVDPGTYNESIQVANKDVRIVSAGGDSVCFLVAPPGTGAIGFSGVGQNTVLSGFTITNSSTAISFNSSELPTVVSNTIVNCINGVFATSSSPIIRSNRFLSCANRAISISAIVWNSPTIERNVLQGNFNAIWMNGSGHSTVRNNIIRDNVGDAILCSSGTVAQNLIVNSVGSGITLSSSCNYGLLVLNNTIVGSTASSAAGITCVSYGGCVRIVNNIIVGNLGITGDGTPPLLTNNNIFSRYGAAYSGTVSNQTGISGNISADPYFACEPNKDFHLLAGSPCIDSGTSNGVAFPMTTDFDEQPRFVSGQTNGAGVVDMGAYEFNPLAAPERCMFLDCPADIVVVLPAGQDTGVISYPAPYATPGATITSSPQSGSVFPAADNLVSVGAVYGTNSLSCNFLIRLFQTTDYGRALNLTNTDWLSVGDTTWFVQNNITHSGFLALRSGTITNNQTSTVQTTLTGPGTLTFWWKVSSQLNRDLLSLKVNSSTQAVISGSIDWQPRAVYIGSGPHLFEWTYAKDASGSSGQDAAWLDQVSWVNGTSAPFITKQPTNITTGVGMSAPFSVEVAGTPPLNYQWRFNGISIAGATNSSLVLTNAGAWNVGSYSVVVSNLAGTVVSTNASLTLARVLAWGLNTFGQTNVPVGLTNVAAIAGGWRHSVALKFDGTVIAWGSNNNGQTNVPASLSNVVAISSRSGDHSMALRADGSVVVWGANTYGVQNVPAGLSNVVAISAGGLHCLALKSDGTAVSWGYFGTVPAGLSNVVAISAGDSASLFLRGDGTVAAFGASVPAYVTNIIAIAAGGLHNLALRPDGTVIAWGDNSQGQTTIPPNLTNAVAIAAGDYHSMALRSDGTVVVWGRYFFFGSYFDPVIPASLANVMAIAAGSDHDLVLLGTPRPKLSIIASGLNVVLNWPTNALGFTLQSTTNLFVPVWSAAYPEPSIFNGQYTVTNFMSKGQQYYRLQSPN
jgi:parallel beta-helix repeat protein